MRGGGTGHKRRGGACQVRGGEGLVRAPTRHPVAAGNAIDEAQYEAEGPDGHNGTIGELPELQRVACVQGSVS